MINTQRKMVVIKNGIRKQREAARLFGRTLHNILPNTMLFYINSLVIPRASTPADTLAKETLHDKSPEIPATDRSSRPMGARINYPSEKEWINKPFQERQPEQSSRKIRARNAGRSRRGEESEWFPGELPKCFRDERFSACGEKRVRDPRGFGLYIDNVSARRPRPRPRARQAGIPCCGARKDSWFLTSCLTKIHPPMSLPGPKMAIKRGVREEKVRKAWENEDICLWRAKAVRVFI